jgi:hypothetical protein
MAEAQELASDGFWAVAYSGAAPSQPVLVQNLTPHGSDYFILDFQKKNRSTGRMAVNRDTGVVDVAVGIEVEGEELPAFIVPADVQKWITPEITLSDGRKVHAPTTTPTVVVLWQHCRESQSMLQPFYWLRWPTSGLFLRVDGQFFDRLTPTDGMPPRVA